VRDVPKSTSAPPESLPDEGAYVDERDRPVTRPRAIDCSVAHAERGSAAKSKERPRVHQGTDERNADVER
jgi:hypothetical protein